MPRSKRWLRWSLSWLCLVGGALCAFPLLPAQSALGNDPSTALEGVLTAACVQKPKQFSKHLTVRNAEAYSQMTAAAQTTLLKRFVLLEKPGTPQVRRDSPGTLSILCVTPEITTEMLVGKAEVYDNLAYIPLTVRDVADSSSADARRVTMGMVRENGQWKLLALGLLFLDLPALAEEWDRAEIQANEKAALLSMKEVSEAVEKYRITYTRLPESLLVLAPPASGPAKSEKAGLLGEELASGRKDGYAFRYVIVGANNYGAPAKYELAAIPIEYGRTGIRSFFRDENGVFHAADHHGAVGNHLDPKLD